MAKLGIIEKFKAKCGTVNVYGHDFSVEIVFEGKIIGDFVSGVDYGQPRKALRQVVVELEGKHLNEILGRVTDENIARYFIYKLRSFPLVSVKIIEDGIYYVELFTKECDFSNYKTTLAVSKGKYFLINGRYEDGIKEFSYAISQNSKLYEAFNLRGRCYKYIEQYKKALNDFSQSIKLNPKSGEAYRNRGNVHYYLNNEDLMIPDFNMAIKLMPKSALAYNNRGFAFQKLKKYKQALADHSKAIELDSEYAEAYKDRGDALTLLGETEKSKNDYKFFKKLAKEQKRINYEVVKVYNYPFLV